MLRDNLEEDLAGDLDGGGFLFCLEERESRRGF